MNTVLIYLNIAKFCKRNMKLGNISFFTEHYSFMYYVFLLGSATPMVDQDPDAVFDKK
jgi:hypothetical protein